MICLRTLLAHSAYALEWAHLLTGTPSPLTHASHLSLQVALVAMEQPLSFSAEHIRQEKLKVLNACTPLQMEDVVTGQVRLSSPLNFANLRCTSTPAPDCVSPHSPRGCLRTGQYAGYSADPGIANDKTRTETFAAAVLHVHNPRWDGVPFVLKAGKALNDSKVLYGRIKFGTTTCCDCSERACSILACSESGWHAATPVDATPWIPPVYYTG